MDKKIKFSAVMTGLFLGTVINAYAAASLE